MENKKLLSCDNCGKYASHVHFVPYGHSGNVVGDGSFCDECRGLEKGECGHDGEEEL